MRPVAVSNARMTIGAGIFGAGARCGLALNRGLPNHDGGVKAHFAA
jgi:hypothetical protein